MQEEGDSLGQHEPAGQVEVPPHAGGVDLQRLKRSRKRVERAAGVRERTRERLPLGLPRARAALVLLLQRPDEDGGMSRGEPRTGARERRADRVALLGHRRGPSRALAFRYLADLCLREQHEIEGDLRGDTGGDRKRGPELGNASPVRVPRECRSLEAELSGVEVGELDALIAEPGEGPGRSTQLCRKPLSGHLLESHARLDDRREPAGGLDAEGRRHGVLEKCPGDHQRVAMLARERRTGRRHVVCLREHERERPPGDEHRRRVDDVLAGRAAVHVTRRLIAD